MHFLLEVDIDSALDNRLESLLNQYRKKFRDDRINVESSRKDNKDLLFSFARVITIKNSNKEEF